MSSSIAPSRASSSFQRRAPRRSTVFMGEELISRNHDVEDTSAIKNVTFSKFSLPSLSHVVFNTNLSSTKGKQETKKRTDLLVPGKTLFDSLQKITLKYFHTDSGHLADLRMIEREYIIQAGQRVPSTLLINEKTARIARRGIHNNFIGDFWEVYNHHHRKHDSKGKINGFRPETWNRLSGQHSQNSRSAVSKANRELTDEVNVPQETPHVNEMEVDPISEEIIHHVMYTASHAHPSDAKIELRKKIEDPAKLTIDRMVAILKTDGSRRSITDLLLLQQYLRSLFAFRSMSDFSIFEMCKSLTAETLKPNDVIFKQGDVGDKWFIILSGKVRMMINKPGVIQGDGEPCLQHVATLNSGEAFGDQALNNNSPRMAWAFADGTMTLCYLYKPEFKRIMAFENGSIHKDKIHFLRKVPFLNKVNEGGLKLISDRMVTRIIPSGQTIIKEGATSDSVFFVRKGLCAVFRKIKCQDPRSPANSEKQILLGHFHEFDTFNEEPALHEPGANILSPFTVVAVGDVEIGAILAYGEWTTLNLKKTENTFSSPTLKDLERAERIRYDNSRFRVYQKRYVSSLKLAKTLPDFAKTPHTFS